MAVAQVDQKRIQPVPERGVVNSVLVVDDSRAQRRILSSYLGRWGYDVFEAASGEEALEICASEDVDLIVSDWMMPGINGLEFCQKFRNLDRENYGYFILLTSKSDKTEVAQGLDVGADDFLTKPVAGDELLARIRAGERILRMERELTEKNRLVSTTLSEISELYDSLDRDLVEARKLQQSLLFENVFETLRLLRSRCYCAQVAMLAATSSVSFRLMTPNSAFSRLMFRAMAWRRRS